jgi:hypothetical protein
MEEKPRPVNLAGMFIGGQVPFELAGLIFRAFYSAGIDPKSFELAPIYTDAHVTAAIEEMRGKLSGNGAAPQITDETTKRRRQPANTRGGGMKGYLLALISVSPRNRDEMRRLLENQKHWVPKSLDARIHDLVAQKLIHRDADGYYHPTKKGLGARAPKADEPIVGRAKAPKRVKRGKGEKTQLDFLLGVLEKAWPAAMPLKRLKRIFKAKGLRPESASVALHVLKTTGQVESPEKGVYKFVKQQPKETQSDVQSSQP